MTYLRIAAVALTVLFAALLIWLYGVKTTLIWAAAMAAFIGVLYLATTPLRRRQRRAMRALGLDRRGWPLPETLDDDADVAQSAPPERAPPAAAGRGIR